ncbi:MAG TPA: hypothetical protein VJP76_08775 [Candidatus Tumulicola sp.]|nr:hypothetical protein [Candidatus Tumulicola sp.]
MDLALFPLLGVNFFDALAPGGVSTWKRSFELTNGLSIWDCTFTLNSSGPIAGSPQLDLIEVTGTIVPHGGHYREETVNVTSRIAYDPIAKLPVMICTELMHSQNRPHSLESVQMELKSGAP